MTGVSLASGSGGNAYLVESQGALLLIDCGLGYRELKKRAADAGFGLEGLLGVLFTHEHVDHTKGVGAFRKHHPDVPLFANDMTAEAIGGAFTIFENGQAFALGPFEVSAFSIPHDVCDPVGYRICADGKTYFHATDVGSPLDSIGVNLACADAATLESNHDPVLVRQSDRPEQLKRRILGPRGHLSNDQAADLVRRFAAPRLKYLALAHLSEKCNAPHLARRAMEEALAEAGRTDVTLAVLEQCRPGEVWRC